ncbi:Glutaredoxin-1 [Hanseniaspora vineae]
MLELLDIKYLVVSVIIVAILKNVLLKEQNTANKKTTTKQSEMASAAVIQNVKKAISSSKIFVAHKSYCPYCHATLNTLLKDKKIPESKINLLELDTMKDGAEIQDALAEISGQRTVPNIYILGKHIGGNSDLQQLDKEGKLDELLKEALA